MKKGKIALMGLLLIGFGSCKKAATMEQQKEKMLVVSTVSGGDPGFTDGPANAALFKQPQQMVFDASGNLFIADRLNHCIRKMTPEGIVSTFAGTPQSNGYADGAVASAQFDNPWGIVIDTDGNLYVSEVSNNAIRKITAAGVVSTLAGGSGSGFADGTGTDAKFKGPYGLAIDASNNLYVADQNNGKIRKITPAGMVTTLASGISYPWGIAVDKSGNVYFTKYGTHCVFKLSTNGSISAYAGSPSDGGLKYQLQDGPAVSALFCDPIGLAFDATGNLYVADSRTSVIRKITTDRIVSTIGFPYLGPADPGLNATPRRHADGEASIAKFCYPENLTLDKDGNIYVSQSYPYYNHYIRKISLVDKPEPAKSVDQIERENWNKPIGWK